MKLVNNATHPIKTQRFRSLFIVGALGLSALFAAPVTVHDGYVDFSRGEAATLGETTENNPAANLRVASAKEGTSFSSSIERVNDFMAVLDPPDVFLGIYTSASLQVSAKEIGQVDQWMRTNGLTTRVAIAGTFMDIEFPNPEWNIPHDLDAAWSEGALPFVNLAVGTTSLGTRTAYDVASGVLDDAIRAWASVYADWSQGGERRAFIAPLQEMNTGWVSYGLDPENFKLAYARIRQIFLEEGVLESAVLWVFAPNGWSLPGHEFERYYPGDSAVDVVGFSAFNFGACALSGVGWDPYEVSIHPYLERMRTLAPDKSIFLAQTGTVAQGGDKSFWLRESFDKIADFPMAQAIIYFNLSKVEPGASYCNPVDWRVYNPERNTGDSGFLDALRSFENPRNGSETLHQVLLPLVASH